MLEAGEIPALCRNGKPDIRTSPNSNKSLSSKSAKEQLFLRPRSTASEGIDMAVAAETLQIQSDVDHQFEELIVFNQVFEAATAYERPPELEIYGRSLGTIQRLGAFMVEKAAAEIIHSPEAEQARAEFFTSVEEGFGTDMELGGGLEVRDFDSRPIIDGKVMAKDLRTAVSDMTEAGLACAEETARTDRRFLPQRTRSRRDHENALLVDKMAKGETNYNTRIVISPFPEEAAAASGNDYWRNIGYVPHLKRGFVQLYHSTGEDVITGSLSFDGSNWKRIREIFQRRGIEISETEVTDNSLKYAVTDTLSEDEAKALALKIADEMADPTYKKTTNTVDVTSEHSPIINTVFNKSYVHACESLARGYQTPSARGLILQLADKASHFNDRYAKALYEMRANEHRFTDDNMVVLHELLVYSTIEMMRALHLQKTETAHGHPIMYRGHGLDAAYLQALDVESFQSALGGFGADGARNGRTYSACGISISLGEELSRPGDSLQVAFGLSREKLSWHGGRIKKGTCVNCHKHTDVGVKNWCKKCIKC